jgi:Uma2 family endonuclease
MSVSIPRRPRPAVVYPESDGQPIAENTLQFEWIVTIKEGLDVLFDDDSNVFVAGDLLWYPVEGDNKTCVAPDTMVAFGRPKGFRGSYMQWEEEGISPQVVFEVLSPSNRPDEMIKKHEFYERYGVEEYYLYNPYTVELFGWIRRGGSLEAIDQIHGFTSPRLRIRFELDDESLRIFGPDGRRFLTFVELARQRNELEAERNRVVEERNELAHVHDELAHRHDELVHARDELAHERDEIARQHSDVTRQLEEKDRKTERLASQLRALGVEPEV